MTIVMVVWGCRVGVGLLQLSVYTKNITLASFVALLGTNYLF